MTLVKLITVYEEVPLFCLFSQMQPSNDQENSMQYIETFLDASDFILNSRISVKERKWLICFSYLTGKYYLLGILFCRTKTERHLLAKITIY